MKNQQDIDDILKQWPFDPFSVNVRQLHLPGRDVLQMRVDMGLLQLEIDGRPDGKRPHGARTYFDYLTKKANQADEFVLNEDHCIEIDREFVQYYHRRVCWLQLKEFSKAVADADHTLQLMDFCKQHSDDEQWTISHEQYRPFVIYHRTQAAALAAVEDDDNGDPEMAIKEVNAGLVRMKVLFEEYEADEQFEEDELVMRLVEFRDNLKERFEIGDPLDEQLAKAIEMEDYEAAAELRDKIKLKVAEEQKNKSARDDETSQD
jgi:hypothetical protein